MVIFPFVGFQRHNLPFSIPPMNLSTPFLRRAVADVKPWAEKYPDITVETVVVDRPAADVLIGISSTAQLIVVGTRGHGGFAGVLVGSVGLHLLHHAECPVFVDRAAN